MHRPILDRTNYARRCPTIRESASCTLNMRKCCSGQCSLSRAVLTHAYFPTTAIVSLLRAMRNSESAKIALVVNEGIVGVFLFMYG